MWLYICVSMAFAAQYTKVQQSIVVQDYVKKIDIVILIYNLKKVCISPRLRDCQHKLYLLSQIYFIFLNYIEEDVKLRL